MLSVANGGAKIEGQSNHLDKHERTNLGVKIMGMPGSQIDTWPKRAQD